MNSELKPNKNILNFYNIFFSFGSSSHFEAGDRKKGATKNLVEQAKWRTLICAMNDTIGRPFQKKFESIKLLPRTFQTQPIKYRRIKLIFIISLLFFSVGMWKYPLASFYSRKVGEDCEFSALLYFLFCAYLVLHWFYWYK